MAARATLPLVVGAGIAACSLYGTGSRTFRGPLSWAITLKERLSASDPPTPAIAIPSIPRAPQPSTTKPPAKDQVSKLRSLGGGQFTFKSMSQCCVSEKQKATALSLPHRGKDCFVHIHG